MGLIKSINAPSSLAPFSMRDVENQAKAIILQAHRQAEHVLAEAREEIEDLKKRVHAQAWDQGLNQGIEEGRRIGRDEAMASHGMELTGLIAALAQAASEMNASRQALESDGLREVVELALAVARRVTKCQALIDPRVLSANLAEAMKLVVHSSDIRIVIHPAQKQALIEALPRLKLQWPDLEHVEITHDADLSPGGCRIETARGRIDADLDAQLDRVARDLLPSSQEAAA